MASIVDYMNAVLALAQFVELKDGSVYGEVSEFPGIETTGRNMDECKRELRSMIRDWITSAQRSGEILPVINGVDINR